MEPNGIARVHHCAGGNIPAVECFCGDNRIHRIALCRGTADGGEGNAVGTLLPLVGVCAVAARGQGAA